MGKRRGRGEGAIEELPSGKFRVTISGGCDGSGKRLRLRRVFRKKSDAIEWRNETVLELSRGGLPSAGNMTLHEWLTRFLDSRQSLEASTVNYYRPRVAQLQAVSGSLQLAKLKPIDVDAMYAALFAQKKSANQVKKLAIILRTALKLAVKRGLIHRNPASQVDIPKSVREPIQPYDAAQVRRLVAVAIHHRIGALFLLAVDSGMRQGELLGLHWPEVDFARNVVRVERSLSEVQNQFTLKVPKTPKSRRSITVAQQTMDSLRAHRDRMQRKGYDVQSGPVFLTRSGKFIHKNSLQVAFLNIKRDAGLPHLRFHGLRHTNATLLLQAGVNIKIISERLGHEDITTTLRLYAHVLDSDQGQAAAAVSQLFFS